MNETTRVQQDKEKFNAICEIIGYNNAVEGLNELNSVQQDYNMVQRCKALILQNTKPLSKTDQQVNALMQGQKIILGGF